MSTAPTNDVRSQRRERWFGGAVLLGITFAMSWPVFGPLEADSFPLSTFPMFAKPRGQPSFHQLVGFDAEGKRVAIAPELLGTSEVLQAKTLIDEAARSKRRREALCARVAERLNQSPKHADVERLELVRLRFDPVRYFVEGPEPLAQRTLHTCRLAPLEAAP